MLASSKTTSIVGLDLEAGSVAATELKLNGSVSVVAHGVAPLSPGVFHEGEVIDSDALAAALKELFAAEKLSKSVRLGIANQRVAVRTLHLPAIDKAEELETAIRFQAQDHIPMPVEQAVLDWEVVGHKTGPNGERQIEVVVVAARRDMVTSLVRAMRDAGLRPVGIDLSAFGMIRALANGQRSQVGASSFVSAPVKPPSYEDRVAGHAAGADSYAPTPDTMMPARLYCNLGDVINLAVAQGTACLFTRISPFGVEGIAQKLAERRRLTLEHARQWLIHVGLEQPIEAIDGDPGHVRAARETLAEGAAKLVDELRVSLEFYGAQEGASAVDGVVASGPGTVIPGLVERLQRDLGHPFEIARPAALSHLDDQASARLTLSYGLALED